MIARFSLTFQRLVFFIAAALMLFGAYSYVSLPAQEDPAITIREAVVTTRFRGLSPERMEELVSKPLEVAIRQLPEIKEIRSSSLPGLSIIHVVVFDRYFELDQIWDDLRAEVARAAGELPDGAGVPVVVDDVGDVSVVTAALRSSDHTLAEMGDMATHVRDQLYSIPGVKRIDVSGTIPEAIYIETRNARLAELGVHPDQIVGTLREQNIIRPGGQVDMQTKAYLIEPTGDYDSIEAIAETLISLGDGQALPLRDLADIRRGLVEPAPQSAFFQGDPAVFFAVAMVDGSNVLDFGPAVLEKLADIEAGMPVGYTLEVATYQAEQVERAVYGVSINVLQTLVIVLAVVIILLGMRTGLIVGSIVPLVMFSTLAIMGFIDLPLERMSLATLVIALGLLVDNGIVVAEDFKQRLEEGATRDEALAGVGRELPLPLLSSTATTVLMFLPLMLAAHSAGEYTRSISVVMAITLSVSWLIAMSVTPVLCHRFIKPADPNTPRAWNERMFDPLNRSYQRLLVPVMRFPKLFLLCMVLALGVGAYGVKNAPQSFFPGSDRTQVIVYIDLPAGVTSSATDARMRQILPTITPDAFAWLDSHAAYVGYGGPRFVLSLTPVDPAPNRAVMVLNVDTPANVDKAVSDLRSHFRNEFSDVSASVTRMFLGPSDSSVLEVQVKGPDRAYLYQTAGEIASAMGTLPGANDIKSDWENRIERVVVNVDQVRARRAGVSSADVAQTLSTYFSGRTVSQYREGNNVIPIVARGPADERQALERVRSLTVFGAAGASVPLMQVAEVTLANGYSRIERENLQRTVTVSARSTQMGAEDMVPLIAPMLDELRASLPPGHSIELDGIITQSSEGKAALAANMPMCLAIVVVLLIAQFNSLRRSLIIIATVPLIIVGTALGLKLFNADFGFMPILGILSLAGIILNNGIVMIDRIDIERQDSDGARDGDRDAIVRAAVRRLRPILMTTITTVLGLLPLLVAKDPLFYGMAAVMAAGLAVGTILTLGVVPVLYSMLIRPQTDEQRDTFLDKSPPAHSRPACSASFMR